MPPESYAYIGCSKPNTMSLSKPNWPSTLQFSASLVSRLCTSVIPIILSDSDIPEMLSKVPAVIPTTRHGYLPYYLELIVGQIVDKVKIDNSSAENIICECALKTMHCTLKYVVKAHQNGSQGLEGAKILDCRYCLDFYFTSTRQESSSIKLETLIP